MKSILAFETANEAIQYEDVTKRLMERLYEYEILLKEKYELVFVPKAVIWTNKELATKVFSTIPIPAYTREDFIYMSPDLDFWKHLMVEQLDNKDLPEIHSYYESFDENHLLEILAHELTHHIEMFIDGFEDGRADSIWFEEGMCFYLPRTLLFDEKYFRDITMIEQKLVKVFDKEYGHHSLDDFGMESYTGSLSSIMYDYWRSYVKVKEIVEYYDGDVQRVFQQYQSWHINGRTISLTDHFEACRNEGGK